MLLRLPYKQDILNQTYCVSATVSLKFKKNITVTVIFQAFYKTQYGKQNMLLKC